MLKRICVIGDSHAAALYHGWNAIKDAFPELTLTFFSGPGRLSGLRVSGDAIVATEQKLMEKFKRTSNTDGFIRPADYDVVILCGLQLSFVPMLVTLQQLRRDGQANTTADRTGALAKGYDTEPVGLLLDMLRSISPGIPILLVPAPVPSRLTDTERFDRLAESGRSARLAKLWVKACQKVAASRRATFIPPPPETVSGDGLTTRVEFTNSPARFGEIADDLRRIHMNAAYGALVLRAALLEIGRQA